MGSMMLACLDLFAAHWGVSSVSSVVHMQHLVRSIISGAHAELCMCG
jgi:hypothetical protein